MLYQAHRGVSTEYPENTMPAFEAAVEQGYNYIEADPEVTSDGQFVVFHDKTIQRTCRMADGSPVDADHAVRELTLEQLLTYDAGVFKGEQFRGTRVPLLTELLSLSKEKQIPVKIDNKVQRFTEEEQERLFDLVEASGAPAAFTASEMDFFIKASERFPDAALHYDGPVSEETLQRLREIAGSRELFVWISLDTPLTQWVRVPHASEELCSMIRKYARLGIWILATDEEALEAEKYGADIVETTGGVKPKK